MEEKLNGIAYWFEENNNLAKEDIKRLNLLTFICSILLDIDTNFTFENRELVLNLKPTKTDLSQEEVKTLKLINIALGYKTSIINITPFISMFYNLGNTFTKNTNEIKPYFEEYYNKKLETFKNYNLDCRILNLNNNTFFIHFDEELTNEELDVLKNIVDPEQVEFNVYKTNNELDVW